jgi:hypothetical protein
VTSLQLFGFAGFTLMSKSATGLSSVIQSDFMIEAGDEGQVLDASSVIVYVLAGSNFTTKTGSVGSPDTMV